ncbi:hypothetical protein FCOIX_12759 [Fusarium coicis]|nr:hypothetical protein FCOIX_12759 [Fusarium coicis]
MNDTERDYDHNGDANTELFDADAQLGATSVSICLNIFAGDNTEFHTRNDPAAPFQPSTIIERQGITQVQCFSREIIHGYLSPDGNNATLLVYDRHLDTTMKSRRIREAQVKFQFKNSSPESPTPQIVKIAPYGSVSLLATSATEAKITGYWLSAGASDNYYGKQVGSQWILFENKLVASGTPRFMRFAILLDRENNEEEFECKVTISAIWDRKTLVGSTPHDDPILFDPTLPPTNKLRRAYDIEN